MKRFFNTTGLCNAEDHYMVDPFRNMYDNILNLIDSKQYFLIHAPRQTGKTTFLHALAHRLNKKGNYVSVVCSLESAGYNSITVETANEVFIQSLYLTSKIFLSPDASPPNPDGYLPGNLLLRNYLTDWCDTFDKPWFYCLVRWTLFMATCLFLLYVNYGTAFKPALIIFLNLLLWLACEIYVIFVHLPQRIFRR